MKKLNALLMFASAALVFAACNVDAIKPGGKDKIGGGQATHVSNFAGRGSLCGTFTSIRGAKGEKAEGRAVQVVVALGVCGKMGEKEWKALAVSHQTEQVTVKSGVSEGTSLLTIEGKNVSVKKPDGKSAKIGAVETVEDGATIKLVDGVSLALLIDGKPFSLDQHSKNSTGKSVAITLP